jgi:hypothetical protein
VDIYETVMLRVEKIYSWLCSTPPALLVLGFCGILIEK